MREGFKREKDTSYKSDTNPSIWPFMKGSVKAPAMPPYHLYTRTYGDFLFIYLFIGREPKRTYALQTFSLLEAISCMHTDR